MNTYTSPFSNRYASPEMRQLFSPQYKYSTWRRLWVALAEAEKELGIPISDEQIHELKTHIDDIDFDAVQEYENELHHDVMAHIKAYGDLCLKAAPIIHLGSTSCYVTDNTDVIQMQGAYKILIPKLRQTIQNLAVFAETYADLACLGFTHFQPAQLTTVGKRACLWLQDFVLDLQEMTARSSSLCFLGAKGATGTQASFLSLFEGDIEKVEQLDSLIAQKMGFDNLLTIAGQTYTRKQDILAMAPLAGLAASIHKFATDIRLLAHLREVEEGFGKKQVGSSAMPYKRNPMLSERLCSLSRFVISLTENSYYTAATQWLERSLDDSANRRLSISEAFLAADALLTTLQKVTQSLTVNKEVIARRLKDELPFIATENILMKAVKSGGDRQKLHEILREKSHAAARRVKVEGKDNDLLDHLAGDFNLSESDLAALQNPQNFIGLASRQTRRFLEEQVHPLALSPSR